MENKWYQNKKLITKILIISLIVIVGIILFILTFVLVKKLLKEEPFDTETSFLESGKSYYQENTKPSIAGECDKVSLEVLLSEGLIGEVQYYSECNKYTSYVNVCKLESGKYQYTPMLNCESLQSEKQYGEWTNGTEEDLIEDSSEVRFLYLGYNKIEQGSKETLEDWKDEVENIEKYEIISTTNYYRYRNKEWQWQEIRNEYYSVNDTGSNTLAYYAISPDIEYINSDSQTTAYKWYMNKIVTDTPKQVYVCQNIQGTNTITSLETTCEQREDDLTITKNVYYTCGVKDQLGNYLEVSSDSLCDCSSDIYGIDCKVEKSYYPSGEKIANKESVYYVNQPIEGAIKDVSTKTNVSRYYKEVTTITEKYYTNAPSSTAMKVGEGRWGSWSLYTTVRPKEYANREIETREKISYSLKSDQESGWKTITTGYETLENLLMKLQSLGYNVNSLKDIKEQEELKYKLQLQYRNKNN